MLSPARTDTMRLNTTTDAARCDADAEKVFVECTQKIAPPANYPSGFTHEDYDVACKYLQDMYACYPPCFCTGDSHKEEKEQTEKDMKEILEDACTSGTDAADDCTKTCNLKCGSAAGLRAGALTTFLVAAFALLAKH